MQTGVEYNRKHQLIQAVSLLMICLCMIPTISAAAPAGLDPRPETLPFFYDPSGLFNDGERGTLERDAKLLQSSEIPTVIYVRSTLARDAGQEGAQAFADAIRLEWAVETAPGKDDGLVLLYTRVPYNSRASTVVASWGETTFQGNGLTPEYIESVLAGDARALLDQGHPFEALVYAMREIRYGGIYFAPSPAPLKGTTRALHSALTLVAPVLLVAVVVSYATLSFRLNRTRLMSHSLVWKVVGATGLIIALMSVLSVIGRSRIGIGSVLLMAIALAIQVRVWTHPAKLPSRARRQRSVPPTSRRMKKVSQARRMHPLAEAPR